MIVRSLYPLRIRQCRLCVWATLLLIKLINLPGGDSLPGSGKPKNDPPRYVDVPREVWFQPP